MCCTRVRVVLIVIEVETKNTKIADGGKFIDGSQDRKQKEFIRMIFLSKLFIF